MLAFIRKRFPSKERIHEHKIVKDDEHIKKLKSNEKNKKKSASTIGELVVGPSTSPCIDHINQSYSDIDYFPMKSGGIVNDKKLSTNHDDSTSDCYFSPSETFEIKNDRQHTIEINHQKRS